MRPVTPDAPDTGAAACCGRPGQAAVSDLNRLGRRGAYRLGRLGSPAPAPCRAAGAALSLVGRPGTGAPWRCGCWAALAAAVLIALGAAAGWWFLPFLAGLAGGAAARYGRWRLRVALPAAALVAAAGWAIPLGWQAVHGAPVRATARVVAALAGLPPHASVAIVVTLVVAAAQALAGLWLTWALIPRQ